jgi:hypothetical protein
VPRSLEIKVRGWSNEDDHRKKVCHILFLLIYVSQDRSKGMLVSICFLLSLDQRRGLGPKGSSTCLQGEISHNISSSLESFK